MGRSALGRSKIVPVNGLEAGDKGVNRPNGVDDAEEKSSFNTERLSMVLRGESKSVSGAERGFQKLNCKASKEVRGSSAGM